MDISKRLALYSYRYHGNWNAIRKAIQMQEEVTEVPVRENYVTLVDAGYPSCLKQLKDPPWVLFYKGDITLLEKPMVTIVGSRNVSTYGAEVTGYIADRLKDRYCIVSGLARGVDAIAHRHALQGGKTIAVIGHGTKYVYPAENAWLYSEIEEKGLILSEFPYATPISRYHFPVRNRILAALGQKLFVTQARLKSGTMHTVSSALDLGKEVCCVPYPFGSEEGKGCNRLIDEGAQILYDVSQLTVENCERFM